MSRITVDYSNREDEQGVTERCTPPPPPPPTDTHIVYTYMMHF